MLGGNPEVKHMGWLGEKMQGIDGTQQWRPVFVALTQNDLLLYEHVPSLKSEWATPKITRPLIATRLDAFIVASIPPFLLYFDPCRLVHTTARSNPVIAGLSDVISFTTRTGTKQGIESHILRVETHRDLATWVKTVVHTTYDACALIREVTCRTFLIIFH